MLENTVRNTKQAKSKLSKSPTLALYENNIFEKTLSVNIIFSEFSAIDGNIIFPVKQKSKKISYFL